MSVLIKGMYIPRMCAECAFMGGLICPDNVYTCDCPVADDVCGVNITQAVDEDCRHPDCPLVEVPKPHGRLIDADATMKQWGLDKATKYGNENAEQQHFSYSSMMMYEVADILDDAPIVIEAEGE